MTRLAALLTVFLATGSPLLAQERVPVEFGSEVRWLANIVDPSLGTSWTAPSFDDASWTAGRYGLGYETDSGAEGLIRSEVDPGSYSVYARTAFEVDDLSAVQNVYLGMDYDDGWVAWINGTEVARSASMPAGVPAWNTAATAHESSNRLRPRYEELDVSTAAIPALVEGDNLLAIGIWNSSPLSTDLVLVPQLTLNKALSLTRGPYLQTLSDDAVTIRWRTAGAEDSRVVYGSAIGSLGSSETDAASTTEHEITLDSLDPDTLYYYAIGSTTDLLVGDDARHFFRTAPEPGTRKATRFWVLGDSGTGDDNARNVRDAYLSFEEQRATDLWLMLGDNAYPNGTDQEYQDNLFEIYPETLRTSPLWPTLGNHDGFDAGAGTWPYFDMFSLPTTAQAGGIPSGSEAYYSFDFANIHFVVLDSQTSDRSLGGPMLTWLQVDLLDTEQEWIVAYWHHAPYSKGSHDSDTELRLVEMRQNVVPILEDYGVDLVLSGHSHSYERSYLIDGHYSLSTTFAETMKLDGGDGCEDTSLDGCDSGDGAYEKPLRDGVPYAGSGDGAVYTQAGCSGSISTIGTLDHPAMYRGMEQLGSVVIDVDGPRLDALFLSDTAEVLDRFSIVKPDCPNGPADSDNDGVCNDLDCSPNNAQVQFPPAGVTNLRFVETYEYTWDADPLNVGGTVYDIVRGELADLPVGNPGEACAGFFVVTNSAFDVLPDPDPGEGRYFVVRSRNDCSVGDYGEATAGPRVSAACP